MLELSKDSSVAESLRSQIKVVLRHYPSKQEVLLIGKRDEKCGIGDPLLSSDTEYR